mgnify:CR=1 FL=1
MVAAAAQQTTRIAHSMMDQSCVPPISELGGEGGRSGCGIGESDWSGADEEEAL